MVSSGGKTMQSQDLINKMPPHQREQFHLDLPITYQALLPLERKVLKLIIDKVGYKPFNLGQLEQNINSTIVGAELKLGLLHLRQKGIVFTLRKTWGEHVYMIPRDTFASWYRLFMEDSFNFNSLAKTDKEIELIHDSRSSMAHDVFYLLIYIAKNGLPITQKGTISKRHLQKIITKINVRDEDLQGMSLQYAGQELYPPSFAVIYDAALRLRLLQQEVERVVLHESFVPRWLKNSAEQMQESLYQMWTQLHIPSLTGVQHFTLILEQMPRGQWFLLDPILNYLVEDGMIPKDSRQDFLITLEEEWLNPLSGLGWIEKGKTKTHQVALRWTASQEGGDQQFYIQPDFEILVPFTVPFKVLWELDCIAEHKQSDRVSRYLISKDSIQYAHEQGRSVKEIIQFLKQHSKYGIPENVELMVEQWGSQFGQVGISEVLLLSCRDQETAQSIVNHPLCSPYITPIGKKDFIIAREHSSELLKNLDKYGFSPMKSIQTSENECVMYPKLGTNTEILVNHSDEVGSTEVTELANNKSQGLIYAKYAVNYYEWETKEPKLEEVYPRLEDVPAIWLNEYRDYHKSTRKELVEKAIEWKVYLKLNKQGETVQFTPMLLREYTNQQWKVQGMELSQEVWLSPEHWKEMQLILPGINDI